MPIHDKYLMRDKRLLRLERELNRLHQAQWRAPIIPLEHPYQRGWVKTYQLREDALHHPEVTVYQAVLPVVNQRVTSRQRDFMQKNGVQQVLRPRIIPVCEWVRRPWPVSHQRLFAYGQWELENFYPWTNRRYRECIRGFRLMRTWWLEEIVGPLMITHQRVDLPEVRSRIAEIESYFTLNLGRERLNKLHGRRSRWRENDASASEQRASSALVDQIARSNDT